MLVYVREGVRMGTFLYVFGSCGRHSELTEFYIILIPKIKERLSSSLTFPQTGQATVIIMIIMILFL